MNLVINMIGAARDVEQAFDIKQYHAGYEKAEYYGSEEVYSFTDLTALEFEEKYGESIQISKGGKVYLKDIIEDMNGDTITIIGDPAKNSIFTILL